MIRGFLRNRCTQCSGYVRRRQATKTWTGRYLCIMCAQHLKDRKQRSTV